MPKLYPTSGDRIVVKYEKKGSVDLIKEHLMPHISKIEGMETSEFVKKSESSSGTTPPADKPAAPQTNSESEKARHMLFAPDRFKLKKSYQMESAITTENIISFIKKCEEEKVPIHLGTHSQVMKKNSVKIVGDDFEHLVYKASKNVAILFEPARKGEYLGIRKLYEILCAERKSEDPAENVLLGRYNVINESSVFRYEGPVPAIGVFPKNAKDKPVYLDLEQLLKQGYKEDEILKEMKEFIRKNVVLQEQPSNIQEQPQEDLKKSPQ